LFGSNGAIWNSVLRVGDRISHEKFTVLNVRFGSLIESNAKKDAFSDIRGVAIKISFARTSNTKHRNDIPLTNINHPRTVLNDDGVRKVLMPSTVQLRVVNRTID
jgi:hypothetical protein